jgi:hypothetical protein
VAYSNEPIEIYASTSKEILAAYLLVNGTSIPMRKERQALYSTISKELVSFPYVRYRIVVKTQDNKIIKSPEYKITVIEKENIVELVTPSLYEKVSNKRPDIVFIFNTKIDPSSITILLDKINITKRCEITPYSVYYKPTKQLSIGEHKLEIIIENITRAEYAFSVVSTKYVQGYIRVGLRYTSCDDSSLYNYLPYKPGFRVPLDMYLKGVLYFPFYFWLYSEETTHFNLELETQIAKILLGDIYPSGSLFTLYVASPRGIQINATSLPVDIELLGGEIEHKGTTFYVDTTIDTVFMDTFIIEIDTTVDSSIFGNYTRYIFGGKLRWSWKNAKVGVSYFYGFDDSTSLYIEPNFLEVAFIEPPLWNNFVAANIEYQLLKNISIGGEYAISRTINIPSYIAQDTIGDAYSIFMKFETNLIDAKLAYNRIEESYYTVGNPYLEVGKRGMLGEFSSSYKNIYYNGTYERYYLYGAVEYYLYTSINYTTGKFAPYIIHSMIGGVTSFTFGNKFNFGKINFSISYGVSKNSNSFRGDLRYEVLKNKLNIQGGYGRSNTYNSLGVRTTFTQNPDLEVEILNTITLEYKGIFNKNYTNEKYSYEENIFTIRIKKTF